MDQTGDTARLRGRAASAAFKALLALGGWVGILLQCGVFTGQADFSSLRYYTLLSNLLIAGYFTVAAVCVAANGHTPAPGLKAALTMGIVVTGLVYHLMLADGHFTMGGAETIANQLLHTFTPIAAVMDWLLFDRKGRYSARSPFLWTIPANLYFVLATVYGFTSGDVFHGGSRFPYFFIDYDVLGVGPVLLYVLGLNAAFIALGYGFVLADRLLAGRSARINTQEA